MEVYNKVVSKIAYGLGYFGAALTVIMMVVVLFEVFMRYVLRNAPVIADELSAYMMVALSFLGAAYTFREKGHVRIDVLPLKLSTKKGNWLRLTTLVLLLAFAITLTVGSFSFLAFSFKVNAHSGTHLRLPLQIPQMALPIGFIMLDLIVITAIYKAAQTIRAGGRIEEEV